MPGPDDFHAHFSGTPHDRIEIVYLKPQQYAVSVGFLVPVADVTVVVLHFKAVQLKDELSVPEQLLIGCGAMTALATEQTLIPTATCFHIRYSDERLRMHRNQPGYLEGPPACILTLSSKDSSMVTVLPGLISMGSGLPGVLL
jgi:hypothetical protein